MDGFAAAAGAIAVILSAIVRLIRTDANWKAVDEGYAGVEHLRSLTGVLEPRALQDIFGPPTMEGVYQTIGRKTVREHRRPTGWLLGDLRLDAAALVVGLLVLIWHPYSFLGDLLQVAFMMALGYEGAGWVVASMLMGKRG